MAIDMMRARVQSPAHIRPKAGAHARMSEAEFDAALTLALSSPAVLTPKISASIDRALEARKVLSLRQYIGLLTKG